MHDAELITQIVNGNTNAFRFLVAQHRKLVLHVVMRMVRQENDVEDVCQEVFIKVFKNLKKFRGDAKLSTWIASIAYNVCINHLRKHKKYKAEESVDEHNWLENRITDHELPGQTLERAELKQMINREVESLPLNYRTVLTLYHLEEFSYKEIEDVTGFPEGTVKNYLFRARKLLKEKLKLVDENEKEVVNA